MFFSVSSIAYIDPGNWATDLEAGANYGYSEYGGIAVADVNQSYCLLS